MTDSEQSKLIISGGDLAATAAEDLQDDIEEGVEAELRVVVVPVSSHGGRLDRVLADAVPEFSRSYLQQLIEGSAVRAGGRIVIKPSTKVKAGEELVVELRPTLQSQAFRPESMALEVVFEDEHLCVINKPAGLVVHPAPGNWRGTLLNGLLARDPGAAFLPRAGIVHRLDKDTSGLMVVARQRTVMDQLVRLIADRAVKREYIALAHGAWKGLGEKRVEAAIGRDPRNRLRMAAVDIEKYAGKSARTDIVLLDGADRHCVVQCKLHTGRTHQIRVHMALLGHPLVADELYGGKAELGLDRQALHAFRLAFTHPVTGESMEFKCLPSADLQAALALAGLSYNQLL